MRLMADLVIRRNQLLSMQTMEKKPTPNTDQAPSYDHQANLDGIQKSDRKD